MNFTAKEIEDAFNMSNVTLVDNTIAEGTGLDLSVANQRLLTCLKEGSLRPNVKAYQIRAWLIRNGVAPSSIPDLIKSIIPEGIAREEALMRWEYATEVPYDHPLVGAIGSQLNLNLSDIWYSIIEL